MNPVDSRRFKVDVFVIRNVIEERLLGRNRKRRNGFASASVNSKVFSVVYNVATDGDESKSRVYVDLSAFLADASADHGVFFKTEQWSQVLTEMYFVFLRTDPTRVVVSPLFELYVLGGKPLCNHVKRPVPLT